MTSRSQDPSYVERQPFFLAIALTAAIRFYLLWQYYCINSDGVHYIDAAKDFYAGRWWEGLASYYSPGYPVLLALAYPLTGDWEFSGQLLSIFCGVAILVPLYLLFLDVYGKRVAVVASFLLALSPFLARYSVHVRSESPFFFLSVVALLLFHRGFEMRSAGRFLAGGLVAGFAYLVRPEAIGFLVVVLLFVGVRWFFNREIDFKWAVRSLSLLTAGFAAFGLPYIVYLSAETGQWGAVSRKAGVTLAVSLSDSGLIDAPAVDSTATEESSDFLGFITHHPWLFTKKVLKDLLPAIAAFFEALHYSYVPFLLIGMVLALRGRFWQRKDFLLLCYVGFFIFGLTLILVRRRYSVQMVPVALGWTALGWVWFWDYLKKRLNATQSKWALGLLVLVFLGATLPKTLTPISREKSYVREAGLYLKERGSSAGLRVAVFDDRVTFYAGARALMLAGVEESSLEGYLKEQKPDYLATEAKTWKRMYPKIADQPALAGLNLEKDFVGTRKDRMLVFKVN